LLAIGCWTPVGGPPEAKKYVLIAAPHTSNWDFVWLLAFARLHGMRIQWVGKHTLFKKPFGTIMRALGGIPVKRDKRHSMVQQLVDALNAADSMCLVVPVEGTRKHVKHWKSGFYHIAREAKVPIVMSFLDYWGRRGGFGPAFFPSGDLSRDMNTLRAFYADKFGKYPHNCGNIRLAEEDEPLALAASAG
jgi:1-acyl-sn-glycerol-3-phosphate acyltransferase